MVKRRPSFLDDFIKNFKKLKLDDDQLTKKSFDVIGSLSLMGADHVLKKIFRHLSATEKAKLASVMFSKLTERQIYLLIKPGFWLNDPCLGVLCARRKSIFKVPSDDCLSGEDLFYCYKNSLHDYVKLQENWASGRFRCKRFIVTVPLTRCKAMNCAGTIESIVVPSHSYIAIAMPITGSDATSIVLYDVRDYQLRSAITVRRCQLDNYDSSLHLVMPANVLVLRTRSLFVFWQLDSFKANALPCPYKALTSQRLEIILGSNLLVCWNANDDRFDASPQPYTVYRVAQHASPTILHQATVDGRLIHAESGASCVCVLLKKSAGEAQVRVHSKDDFSLIRTFELSSTAMISLVSLVNSQFCLMEEFVVLPAGNQGFNVRSLVSGRVVHAFLNDPNQSPVQYGTNATLASGRLFAFDENSNRLYCWDVDSDAVESWRRKKNSIVTRRSVSFANFFWQLSKEFDALSWRNNVHINGFAIAARWAVESRSHEMKMRIDIANFSGDEGNF